MPAAASSASKSASTGSSAVPAIVSPRSRTGVDPTFASGKGASSDMRTSGRLVEVAADRLGLLARLVLLPVLVFAVIVQAHVVRRREAGVDRGDTRGGV